MVNKSGKHGKQKRKGITVQLVFGIDDDLIEAINNLPEGNSRQKTLKQWLRQSQGFASAKEGKPSTASDVDYTPALQDLLERVHWLQENVYVLPSTISELLSQLTVRPVMALAPQSPKQDGVSQEVLDKRAERLKKRGW